MKSQDYLNFSMKFKNTTFDPSAIHRLRDDFVAGDNSAYSSIYELYCKDWVNRRCYPWYIRGDLHTQAEPTKGRQYKVLLFSRIQEQVIFSFKERFQHPGDYWKCDEWIASKRYSGDVDWKGRGYRNANPG